MLSLPLVDVPKNRGINDLDRFLAPSSWSDLPSPFELEEMKPAVTQILHAIRSQRQMTIVGDYDCDGVLSTAILEATLRRLGAQPTVDLPHRDEGYGLSNEVVHRFSTHGTGLLITIDNGINAAGPVRLAQRLGIGVTLFEKPAVFANMFVSPGLKTGFSGKVVAANRLLTAFSMCANRRVTH
jgi:single-stranded-DNA-specific exonuclease